MPSIYFALACCKPRFSRECCNLKEITRTSIVTSIALIAIGLIVLGILIVIAAILKAPSGLSAMSDIGWSTGLILIGSGALIPFVLSAVCCHLQIQTSPSSLSLIEPKQSSSTQGWDGTVPANFQAELQQLKQTLNIQGDVKDRLQQIYGEEKVPSLKLENPNLFSAQVKLLLYEDDQILNLFLENIETFLPEEKELLYARLILINKKPPKNVPSQSREEIKTLSDFRSIHPYSLTKIDPALLTGLHFETFLKSSLDKDKIELARWLPVEGPYAKQLSQKKLEALPEEIMLKTIPYFSSSHLCLLPPNYFAKPNFPWERLGNVVRELFDFSKSPKEIQQKILRQLKMTEVQKIVSYLSADHLSLFYDRQLANAQFPWREFFKFPNFIEQAKHQKIAKAFASETIPWDSLKDQKEISELFSSTEEANIQKVSTFLRVLKVSAIQKLASILLAEHFPIFSDTQLNDKRFPWVEFFKKPGIGKQMRNRLSVTQLALESILWEKFPKEEADVLFSSSEKTQSFLRTLQPRAVGKMAHLLAPQHLSVFWPKQLKSSEFPWSKFVKMKGIGEEIHRSLPYELIAACPIPWEELAQDLEEAQKLFSLDETYYKEKEGDTKKAVTISLLRNLEVREIKILFDKNVLSRQHIDLLNTSQKEEWKKNLS